MSVDDATRWDERYSVLEAENAAAPPSAFASMLDVFPRRGSCIDIACGRGSNAVWLAMRGLHVTGFDVSPVAISAARKLAEQAGIADQCRFEIADLDHGVPDVQPAELVLCHLFRATNLYFEIASAVAPGGYLALAVLSEVDSIDGQFRAKAGELTAAIIDDPALSFEVITSHERDGQSALLAKRAELHACDSRPPA